MSSQFAKSSTKADTISILMRDVFASSRFETKDLVEVLPDILEILGKSRLNVNWESNFGKMLLV